MNEQVSQICYVHTHFNKTYKCKMWKHHLFILKIRHEKYTVQEAQGVCVCVQGLVTPMQ